MLGIADEQEARATRGDAFIEATQSGGGLSTLMLAVVDITAALAALAQRGVPADRYEVHADDGRKICDVAELKETDRALVDLRIVQYVEPSAQRIARHAAAGLFRHAFPLKRLDHLAMVAPSLEETTRFWTETLGIPVTGEISTPALIIRQLTIGDAVLELLGPATPESPIAARPPGLISMTAFEVPDLNAAVAQARAAGFTAPDPATGVLPGTRTATIPATEMSGIGLQLLEYVE